MRSFPTNMGDYLPLNGGIIFSYFLHFWLSCKVEASLVESGLAVQQF